MSTSEKSIAIVGLACVYPDAKTPEELWENVMAQRKAFRRLPMERIRIEDYFSPDKSTPDATYATNAAVIEGYSFDRAAFNVVGTTYRGTDLAHWLALDVASRALADAGFADGTGLPKNATGVLVGNTLTGEFSRANALRVRWPYVRRTIESALTRQKWTAEQCEKFLGQLEESYKSPFPNVGEEWLAGSLSNTIAGRICNHFDLRGGGFTVDGACASSLLAVATACSSLIAQDLDVAIAGGVDLSLDPFEIIGFAKTGALATGEMRVFDTRSSGFLPGEGCGMAVLMRHEDAIKNGHRVYAVIKGWGISSDGRGGLTRPEPTGQLEALRRAYRKAGFGAETVAYSEAHGTGTMVGDAAELEVLSAARKESGKPLFAAALGSIKANIGHTKAAAGIAGLIKATLALHKQVLPPTTGCEIPHLRIRESGSALRILREPELWPGGQPLRASVSAMGFGGINAHIVLENPASQRKCQFSDDERKLARAFQDVELFTFGADASSQLLEQIRKVASAAKRISYAELTDLAARLAAEPGGWSYRAAVLASTPSELAEKLATVSDWLGKGIHSKLDVSNGVFVGSGHTMPSIGFLFPGQAAPLNLDGGIWKRRFDSVRTLYSRNVWEKDANPASTSLMQPAIVTASLAGLTVLDHLNIKAAASTGHSLGELTALHWGGAFNEASLLRIVQARGDAMANHGDQTGAMLAVAAPASEVQKVLNNDRVTVVGFNSPRQTVLAGPAEAIEKFADAARTRGFICSLLPVSHAFHTPMMCGAVPPFARKLRDEITSPLKENVYSTITGDLLTRGQDFHQLLCDQMTSPVQFISAFERFVQAKDLLIEVGPGNILSGLAKELTRTPVISLDAGGASLKGLLQAVGATFALGVPVKPVELFNDRFTRPFSVDWNPRFFSNPCELAPSATPDNVFPRAKVGTDSLAGGTASAESNSVELVRRIISDRVELPIASVPESCRMLNDLHLNSITVGQLVADIARQSGIPCITGLTDFANASVSEIAQAMDELKLTAGDTQHPASPQFPSGIDHWTRVFSVEWRETKRSVRPIFTTTTGAETADFQIFTAHQEPLPGGLRERLVNAGFVGAIVWLPENPDESAIPSLLATAKYALAMKQCGKFVLVQHGWGGSGFAKTFYLEKPETTTLVVNIPKGCAAAVEWIVDEITAARDFLEVQFDSSGRRFEPRLYLAEPASEQKRQTPLLGRNDVLLATGGGKGIATECVLAYAIKTGVALGIIGRSDPATDKELNANLRRFADLGVRHRYFCADVCNPEDVRRAVEYLEAQLGPITGFLHGAGVNTPKLINDLDEESFRKTLQPKVHGFHTVMAAIAKDQLKLLVTFGSIIARTGLPGEADYAVANEWLAAHTKTFKECHPACTCLALEWSVWSGAGMGERLGRIEFLARQGMEAIPIDAGVKVFGRLIEEPHHSTSLVVTGRFGKPCTIKLEEPQLPLQRFLEREKLFYPGVELITEATLSARSDAYLQDHIVQKQPVFPAVMGLEAMAQVAMALNGARSLPILENVEFLRPVVVSESAETTIQIVALKREDGVIETCIRSSETDYQVDHFRASSRVPSENAGRPSHGPVSVSKNEFVAVNLERDLYGTLLFHGPRFRRLAGYQYISARECCSFIQADDSSSLPWFGPYLPQDFVLGNPAARDAAIHAIQACIPHLRILPTGIERVAIYRIDSGRRMVLAKERLREGNHFVYDVEVTDMRGELLERYQGLQLRAVEELSLPAGLPPLLMEVFLERSLEEIAPRTNIRVALGRGSRTEDKGITDAMIQKALGKSSRIWRRLDGRPFIAGVESVSAAHSENYTLAAASKDEISCDLEKVSFRSDEEWERMLGPQRFLLATNLSVETGEGITEACTRIWTAAECMKKIGQPANSSLVIEKLNAGAWITLRSGSTDIFTRVVSILSGEASFVVSFAVRKQATEVPPPPLISHFEMTETVTPTI